MTAHHHEEGYIETPDFPESSHPSHDYKTFLAILCVVILVLLGAIGYLIKYPKGAKVTSNSSNTIQLPNVPTPTAAILSYEYRTVIKDIKTDNRGRLLITDVNPSGILEFLVDGSTTSFMFSKGKEVPMNASVIKIGDKVSIFARYDLTTKIWKINKVDVIVEELATPKASPKLPKLTKSPAPSPKP